MAEFTKVHKLQSSLLVFLSKQPRKEKILDASKEVGESLNALVLSKTFCTRTLGFRTTKFNIVLVQRKNFLLLWQGSKFHPVDREK